MIDASHLSTKAATYANTHAMLRAFLAEDDAELRSLLASVLHRAGYEVLVADDGAELLSYISAVSKREIPRPDVIVMDVRMPTHSGMALLAAMRFAEWDIPVVLMTAFPDERLRVHAALLGARAVLEKPLSAAALVRAVDRAHSDHGR